MANPVVRWQIISPAPEQSSDFYCRLFGWRSDKDNRLNYNAISTGGERGIDGGIWPAPPGAPAFVQLFMEVEDCQAYLEQAVALGGSVLVPVQALPDGDRMAILKDPTGMSFGIMQKRAA